MSSKKERRAAKKVAERIGYRWMMRCLRAAEKAMEKGQASVEVIVHRVGKYRYGKRYKAFVAACKPAAKHAIAMMRNGSFRAGFTFRKAGTKGDTKLERAYPLSHKVIIVMHL